MVAPATATADQRVGGGLKKTLILLAPEGRRTVVGQTIRGMMHVLAQTEAAVLSVGK